MEAFECPDQNEDSGDSQRIWYLVQDNISEKTFRILAEYEAQAIELINAMPPKARKEFVIN